jgi:hypothetical protein
MSVRTGFGVTFLISAITIRAVFGRVLLSKTVTSWSFTITTTFVAVHKSSADGARKRYTPSASVSLMSVVSDGVSPRAVPKGASSPAVSASAVAPLTRARSIGPSREFVQDES